MRISPSIHLPDEEIELDFVRASGAGGQNVNKVSTAVHLRFDIRASSLPASAKQRLLALSDSRISKDGIIVIKARQYRTQEKNRADALDRLRDLIQAALRTTRKRIATQPTLASRQRRLAGKTRRANIKSLRRRPDSE